MGAWVATVAKMLGTIGKWAWANREPVALLAEKASKVAAHFAAAKRTAGDDPDKWVKVLDDTLSEHGSILVDVTKQITAIQDGLENTAKQLEDASKQLATAIEDQAKEIDQRIAIANRKVRLATYSAWVSVGVAVVALIVAIVK